MKSQLSTNLGLPLIDLADAPPRPGEEEEFLLDKAYSLSTRISRDEDDE